MYQITKNVVIKLTLNNTFMSVLGAGGGGVRDWEQHTGSSVQSLRSLELRGQPDRINF